MPKPDQGLLPRKSSLAISRGCPIQANSATIRKFYSHSRSHSEKELYRFATNHDMRVYIHTVTFIALYIAGLFLHLLYAQRCIQKKLRPGRENTEKWSLSDLRLESASLCDKLLLCSSAIIALMKVTLRHYFS